MTEVLALSPAAPTTHGLKIGASAKNLALGLVLPVVLLGGWEICVRAGWAEGRLLPPPSRIFATLRELALDDDLLGHIGVTLQRVGLGFVFGALAGVALGALAGASTFSRKLVDPSIQALRAIPSLAWAPLFLLWFGIFETSKIVLIAAGVFFPVYLGVSAAILDLDRKILEVGRIFRLNGFDMTRRILIPAILPQLITALRAGLGLGWMFVVAAEVMGASQGLGFLLVDGQQLGKPDQIAAAIFVFAICGKATDGALTALSAPFLRWRDLAAAKT